MIPTRSCDNCQPFIWENQGPSAAVYYCKKCKRVFQSILKPSDKFNQLTREIHDKLTPEELALPANELGEVIYQKIKQELVEELEKGGSDGKT